MSDFKFFSHHAAGSYYNMAFDEWMFEDVLRGNSLFSLRLYSWAGGTITFGCNQNLKTALDFDKVDQTPVIRRVTGGRALFHDPSEVTYSVAISDEYLNQVEWGKSVSQSSKKISEILVMFLRDIGIESHFMRSSTPGSNQPEIFHKAPCFESYSRYEILTEAEKIIASAQRRVRGGLLQHGSIKINGIKSHQAIPLVFDNPKDTKVLKKIGLTEFKRLSEIIKKRFENNLEMELTDSQFNALETESLIEREKLVLKNCFLKREMIKQN